MPGPPPPPETSPLPFQPMAEPPPVFGPNFAGELVAAGLINLPLSWTPDGQIFARENLTTEQNRILDAVIAAHDPTKTAVPQIISRRQFFQAAALYGMISYDEALEAMRGTIPPRMQQGLDTLPPDQKFAAEMLLIGANEFERNHPLVDKFGEVMGMTVAQVDDIWRRAAAL